MNFSSSLARHFRFGREGKDRIALQLGDGEEGFEAADNGFQHSVQVQRTSEVHLIAQAAGSAGPRQDCSRRPGWQSR